MLKKLSLLTLLMLVACGRISFDIQSGSQPGWKRHTFRDAEISLPESYSVIEINSKGIEQARQLSEVLGDNMVTSITEDIQHSIDPVEVNGAVVWRLLFVAIESGDTNIDDNFLVAVAKFDPYDAFMPQGWPTWETRFMDEREHYIEETELEDGSAWLHRFSFHDATGRQWQEKLYSLMEPGWEGNELMGYPQYWIYFLTDAADFDGSFIEQSLATFQVK
jgi:hypothetical protein